jgi:hypothetical protein
VSSGCVNPRIPTDYREAGKWLRGFAGAHAKRESPRIEAIVEMDEAREGRSFGLHLALAGVTRPPTGEPAIELDYAEVADERARFAWCEAFAQRVRAEARALVAEVETRSSRFA